MMYGLSGLRNHVTFRGLANFGRLWAMVLQGTKVIAADAPIETVKESRAT